jgi:flavin reductase (DIM6/NTAB) family NADH-FMN oxidoreductase RutF
MDIDPTALRRALGSFPTGVTVVTARSREGRNIGLTANSFTSVSLEPALVSWSLRRQSGLFETFREGIAFAVNVLGVSQTQLANRFARPSDDKFAGVELCAGFGGVPLLAGCIAYFECAMIGCHIEGDHGIFIGKVERFFTGTAEEYPLVFCKGAYMAPHELGAA